MPSLQTLLQDRAAAPSEENLEKGKIWSYSNIATYSTYPGCFCWISPGTGNVEIEAIGAGGSGSRMCCCSATISGNSGAYSKKCISVASGCWICGHAGKSCRNGGLCHRGCSEAARVCWQGNSGSNGCICAQGGWSGASWCTTGTARWRCFACNNWCNTNYNNAYCGIICNRCANSWHGQGYGGDTNRDSIYSCVTFWHCYPNCNCSTVHHTALPAGMFSECGGVATYSLDSNNGHAEWSGMALNGYINSLNSLSRMPGTGTLWSECWDGNRQCGCYQTQGCSMFVPHGSGGPPATPCSGVRDNGWAGGDAIVRIKYIES